MVAAQKRAEMPSCPAGGWPHAPQRSSASWAVVSAKRSVLVGLCAITLLTCLSSVYWIGGRRGPAMLMVEVDDGLATCEFSLPHLFPRGWTGTKSGTGVTNENRLSARTPFGCLRYRSSG